MYVYLLTRQEGDDGGYDSFDSCVVVANSAKDARKIHPESIWSPNDVTENTSDPFDDTWPSPNAIDVECIGVADKKMKRGVVCASFNAG